MAPGDAAYRLALTATAVGLIGWVASRRGLVPLWSSLAFIVLAFGLVAAGTLQKRGYRAPLPGDGPRYRIARDGTAAWDVSLVPPGQRLTFVRFDFLEQAPPGPISDAATAGLAAVREGMILKGTALESVLERPAGRAGRFTAEVLFPGKEVPIAEAKRAAELFERGFTDSLRKAGVTGVRRSG
ncbi:MAG: hypothetical protein WDA16_02060 [Candidatus Thermoplasmatota archaeon]